MEANMKPRRLNISTNQQFYFINPEKVYLIRSGFVDLFSIDLDEERQARSPRRYLFRAMEGEIIFSLQTEAFTGGIVLMGISTDAKLIEFPATQFPALEINLFQAQIEAWIRNLSSSVLLDSPPRNYQALSPGKGQVFEEETFVFPTSGLLWAKVKKGEIRMPGALQVNGETFFKNTFVPVTSKLWIHTGPEGCELEVITSRDLIYPSTYFNIVRSFQRVIGNILKRQLEKKEQQAQKLIARKVIDEKWRLRQSLGKLGNILLDENSQFDVSEVGEEEKDHLFLACRAIGNAMEVPVEKPKSYDPSGSTDPLLVIAQVSNLRIRKVILRGEWWTKENGHLLAFENETKKPLALLQRSSREYQLYDPETGGVKKVNKARAHTLNPSAYMFFKPFPERMTDIRKLLEFTIQAGKKDFTIMAIVALGIALIGLLMPVLNDLLFDDVIPLADRQFLYEIVGIMFTIGIVTALLTLTQEIWMLRLETKVNKSLQAALMDHILRLPVTFFRKFSSGDLTLRALTINAIRQIFSNVLLTSVLSGIFSIVNLGLLFYYAPELAWFGLGLGLLAMIVVVLIGRSKLKYDREMMEIQGGIQGVLFEFLSGISKIRVAGAETRMFSLWSTRFAQLKNTNFKSGSLQNYIETFNKSYPLLTSMVFFFIIYYNFQNAENEDDKLITIGAFMAFITAFGQFLNQSLSMGMAAITSLNIIPLYERIEPILTMEPESLLDSEDPGTLNGAIEFNHVSFRYADNLPLVLNEVTFSIQAGEMVAFVGPSGSGKSTILRILLGFEEPESGAVFYDGLEFNTLNKELVRNQTGVVLQNGSLMPGSIYKNIVGDSHLTLEDAWEAARMAGMEEDINQMPMGMHTVISEGASTFSGGQRQRLMIARAIVHRPRILFMDEATSALDNRTQSIVQQSLDKLQATRIIVAHRLSTIVNAHRILVFDDGRIVEQGTYHELMEQDGLFAKLAKRQIA